MLVGRLGGGDKITYIMIVICTAHSSVRRQSIYKRPAAVVTSFASGEELLLTYLLVAERDFSGRRRCCASAASVTQSAVTVPVSAATSSPTRVGGSMGRYLTDVRLQNWAIF